MSSTKVPQPALPYCADSIVYDWRVISIHIQGIPKGTDTFKSLIVKNWISLFHITKVSMKCPFFDNFGKTVNLNCNGLTGLISLCSILTQEKTKKYRFLCPFINCSYAHSIWSIDIKTCMPLLHKSGQLLVFSSDL